MTPWVSIVLFGFAVFGFAWLSPRGSREDAEGASDPAYDRLLEELETENRELLDAVSKFKQEQDETVRGLVRQIAELERRIETAGVQASAENAAPAAFAENAASAAPAADTRANAEAVKPDPAPAYAPTSIRARYAGLLAMHAKGKSVEQIARSAGMNKGEVQLILQLARREEDRLA